MVLEGSVPPFVVVKIMDFAGPERQRGVTIGRRYAAAELFCENPAPLLAGPDRG